MEPKFSHQLKTLRKSLNLTQQQLADKVGLSVNSIRRYESGEREPSMRQIVSIAEKLNLSLSEFLWGKITENEAAETQIKKIAKNLPDSILKSETGGYSVTIAQTLPLETIQVTPDEKTLVNTYRDLNQEYRELTFEFLQIAHQHSNNAKEKEGQRFEKALSERENNKNNQS